MKNAYEKLSATKDKYKNDLEVCTNYLLEVEEKCQEAQKTSIELLQHLKDRDSEIERLHEVIVQLRSQTYIPDNVFVYYPVKDDPVDQKLALFINQMPFEVRDKMRFEREAEGVYKYGKKRVFMKIEKDQIIIRVGGGYLTIEEFIEQYCDGGQSADSTRRRLFGLIYGGNCQGSKDFKTFYFTQKTIVNEQKQQEEEINNSSCINIKDVMPEDYH